MKKLFAILLAVFMLLSCSMVCFGAENESADVFAKYEGESKRTESPISDDFASVTMPDGTDVIVENIPSNAVMLVVYSVPTSEAEAWSWIKSCFTDIATPIHTFDIYFADENGNRINADDATVTIDCPHCKAKPMVCSLTTDGEVKELSNNTRSVSVTFTTDGSHYYVLAEKLTEPSKDNKVDIKDNQGGDVEVSDKTPNTGDTVTITPKPDDGKVVDKITVTDKDGNKIEVKDNGDGTYSYEQPDGDVTIDVTYRDKTTTNAPQTGDSSHLWLWWTLAIIAAATLIALFFLKRKKQEQQ